MTFEFVHDETCPSCHGVEVEACRLNPAATNLSYTLDLQTERFIHLNAFQVPYEWLPSRDAIAEHFPQRYVMGMDEEPISMYDDLIEALDRLGPRIVEPSEVWPNRIDEESAFRTEQESCMFMGNWYEEGHEDRS